MIASYKPKLMFIHGSSQNAYDREIVGMRNFGRNCRAPSKQVYTFMLHFSYEIPPVRSRDSGNWRSAKADERLNLVLT